MSKKLESKIQNINISGDYINPRQKEIIRKIQLNGSMKLAELSNLFPDNSIHTIKKDLQLLVSKELINKFGDKKGAFYYIESLEAE